MLSWLLSGAVAVGASAFGMHEKPTELKKKQACSAVGQARLMMIYQKLFSEYNQMAAQILMTKNTMVNNLNRRNARNTFEELLELGAIPVVNENDSISSYELEMLESFGDNDTLSAVIAGLIGADLLIRFLISTDFLPMTRIRPGCRIHVLSK